MPTIEQLQQFKKILDQLQGEPDYAASQGWVIEEVEPPAAGEKLVPTAEELIRPLPFDSEAGAEKSQTGTGDTDGLQGTDSLLDWSLEDDSAPTTLGGNVAPGGGGSSAAGDDFSLGEEDSNPSGDDFSLGEEDLSPSGDDFSLGEEDSNPSGDDFSLGEEDSSPSGDDFSLGEEDSSPSGDDFSLGEEDSSPSGDDFLPGEEDSSPSGDDFLPGEEDSSPSGDDFLPGEEESRAAADYFSPGEEESRAAADYFSPGQEQPSAVGDDFSLGQEEPSAAGDDFSLGQEQPSAAGDDFSLAEESAEDKNEFGPAKNAPLPATTYQQTGAEISPQGAASPNAVMPEENEEKQQPFSVSARIVELEAQLADLSGANGVGSQPEDERDFCGEYLPLSAKNQDKLLKNLDTYPLNLRIAVEKEIGNGNLAAETVDELLGLIIRGSSPKHLANRFFELSGKRVLLPKNLVMRLSQEELARRHYRFSYQFSQLVWPWLRVYPLAFLALCALILGLFHLAYRPLMSENLYRRGEREIKFDRYKQAERLFDQARYGWPLLGLEVAGRQSVKWYLRYAAAYAARYNFVDGEAKYQAMLEDLPLEGSGWLNYAAMLLYQMHDYPRVLEVINSYHSQFGRSQTSLLLLGAAYLALATEQPAFYVEAEKVYTAALSFANEKDDQVTLDLLRFLLLEQQRHPQPKREHLILQLLSGLLERDHIRGRNVGTVLSEAARYMLGQRHFNLAHTLLERSVDFERNNIDTYMQYSYYYRTMSEPTREHQALSAVLYFLNKKPDDDVVRPLQRVYAYHRLAQLSLPDSQALAVEWFNKALQAGDYSRLRFFAQTNQVLGELYGDVGDLLFESSHFDNSRSYYQQARDMNYRIARVNFRLGYIYYRQGAWQQAVNHFYPAQQQTATPNLTVDFALATSLLNNQNWQSAAGLYAHVARSLDYQLEQLPDDSLRRLARRELLKTKMKSLNNEAASLYQHFLQTSNQQALTEAMTALQGSITILDALSRDSEFQLKIDEKLLESETMTPMSELDRLAQKPSEHDMVRDSLPRKNFFVLLHPQQRQKMEAFPLTSEEVLAAGLD